MKLFLFINLFSSHLMAADLIYKNSFENSALLTGTVSGVLSSGLSLYLISDGFEETIIVEENGVFIFNNTIPIGDSWQISVITLPSSPQQNCSLKNSSGVMIPSGSDITTVTCNDVAWNWDQMNWDEGGWQ